MNIELIEQKVIVLICIKLFSEKYSLMMVELFYMITDKWYQTSCRKNLNTRLVPYSNGINKSGCQMISIKVSFWLGI